MIDTTSVRLALGIIIICSSFSIWYNPTEHTASKSNRLYPVHKNLDSARYNSGIVGGKQIKYPCVMRLEPYRLCTLQYFQVKWAKIAIVQDETHKTLSTFTTRLTYSVIQMHLNYSSCLII